MIGHVEELAVCGQGAPARLRAHLDRRHHAALDQADDGDGTADAVGDVGLAVGRVDCHAARLQADGDLGQLVGDVIAARVFHADDRDTVRRSVDDDETCLVRGEGNGSRAARGARSVGSRQTGLHDEAAADNQRAENRHPDACGLSKPSLPS